ncbi:hypothetical protein CL658_05455 [bacterium]|nr:hypothetical protein [bacterium]
MTQKMSLSKIPDFHKNSYTLTMIYYNSQTIISQLTHAHLSRVIAESLIITDLSTNLILPLAIACHYHDHGWKTWEENPSTHPHTQHPLDFQEIDPTTHIKIWTQSREIATTQHPLVGYLVSKHTIYLSNLRLNNTTDKTDSTTLTKFQKNEIQHQESLRSKITRLPSQTELKKLQHYLAISDYISLMICLNTNHHETIINNTPIKIHQNNHKVTISLPLKAPLSYLLRGTSLKNKGPWTKQINIECLTE